MARKANALGNRFEGRLFIDEGRLHFVVEVDVDAGFARVSFRADGQHQVIEMPLAEVATQLAKNSKIILDGMSSADKAGRITQDSDGWYFNTRDGRKGPYPSDDEAAEALEDSVVFDLFSPPAQKTGVDQVREEA